MSIHYFSLHAHFYQPPREDPLTGLIPLEPGASPYPNWNERIHAECYRPNAEMGNFKRLSFNIGATLFSWMAEHDPSTYHLILTQDRENLRRYGVGNAIAQAYNHTILPLASYQDKVTQVYWGIADFAYRFGRKPQGMWLPETAADVETLSVLAAHGIEFTILAPWQAQAERLDVSEPYRIVLPEGRSLVAFFYHADLSAGISFDPGMTINADDFAIHHLAQNFNPEKTARGEAQLLLLASDGELYGHHQPLREHFLARLVDGAGSLAGASPTYPALWLQSHPAEKIVTLRENTSWSCHHGLGRWTGECVCTPSDGGWKKELHRAFNHLAHHLDRLYLDFASGYVADPWELRNRYIHVLLGQVSMAELISEMARQRVSAEIVTRFHWLLESQRERQRMFTSCGWFFDDFDRIEPRNNVAYAAQAVLLARLATGVDLTPVALEGLKHVTSPQSGLRGDHLFAHRLRRATLDERFLVNL